MAIEFKSNFAGLVGGTDEAITLDEHASAPATPASGQVVVYAKADGKVYRKDDAGAESELGGGGDTTALENEVEDLRNTVAELAFDLAILRNACRLR